MALAPSTLAVDLDAYAHNLGVIRSYIPPETGIMAVVKADAYGLGAAAVARRAVSEGVNMLAVATVGEGIALREVGIESAILVLVNPPDDALPEIVRHGLRTTIADVRTAEHLGDIARKAKKIAIVHCEIDTGMGRQGFDPETAAEKVLQLTRISNIDIEGICTHFPGAESPADPFTSHQTKTFRQALRDLDKEGIPYEMAHAANSAALVNYPHSCLNMVRPGIMAYGVWPSDGAAPPDKPRLRSVVKWTSTVVLVRDLPGGASVGYGRTYKAPSPRKVALVPVGYADGYDRRLSNAGEVLVRNTRCPVIGVVSMDQIVVDVTGLPAIAPGDSVTLLGTHRDNSITIEDVARKIGTVPHEVLTAIGRRVARVYVP